MSTILGSPLSIGGGGAESGLNIAYGLTPPADTSKLWVRMEGKPEFVESTDKKNVQVGEFTQFIPSSDLITLARNVVDNVKTGVVCNGKMYIASNSNWSTFNAIDLETKVISKNFTSYAQNYPYPAWCSYKNKMYLLGGRPTSTISKSTVRIYDTESDTWTAQPYKGPNLGTSSTTNAVRGSTCVYDGVIYVFGGACTSPTEQLQRTVLTFDTNTYESTSFVLSPTSGSSTIKGIGESTQDLCVIDGIAYFIFTTGNSSNSGSAYKIDLVNKTVSTYFAKATDLVAGTSLVYCPGVQIGNKFYIMVDERPSKTHYGKICEISFGETGCELTTKKLFYDIYSNSSVRAVIGDWSNAVYVLWGEPSYAAESSWGMQKMPYQFPLQSRWLLMQEGGTRLCIINTKKSKVYTKIQYLLLGDSNNLGQEVKGYLYDTTQQKWISLDGIPYTA